MFIHGGPGLNSNPERKGLSNIFLKNKISCIFWDEPSALRQPKPFFGNELAYSNCLKSIHSTVQLYKPKILIGGSFGSQTCLDYIKNYKHDVDLKLIFISPTFDIFKTILNMILISEKDFYELDTNKFFKIQELKSKIKSFWDENMKQALMLAWENPKLASYYFVDTEKLKNWFESISEPKYLVDSISQDAVFSEFKSWIKKDAKTKKFKLERNVTLLVGDKDPVWNNKENIESLQDNFKTFETVVFKNTAHFPHLEKPELFVKLINKLLLN